jgi:flagellar basal body rod protein FlgG
MSANTRKHEIVARNLSHVGVPGYKREIGRLEGFAGALDGALHADAIPQTTVAFGPGGVDLSPGLLKPTGAPLDVAIEGDGFFVIEAPQGKLYTRNGRFHRDGLGRLVTAGGATVLGQSGPIFLPPGEVTVSGDGRLVVDSQEVGRLAVVRFGSAEPLHRREAAAFASDEPPEPVERPHLRAGFLEKSNVTVTDQLVELIATVRSFQSNQRAAQLQDESLKDAIALAAE